MRMMHAAMGLAVLLVLVLGYGLLYVFNKNIAVAPWAQDGQRGRIHFHTKNTTRFGGSATEVAAAVQRAVFLDEPGASPAVPADWRDVICQAVQPGSNPQHVVVLPSDGDHASAWALPGAYWAMYAQVPVAFAGPIGSPPMAPRRFAPDSPYTCLRRPI